MMLLRGTILPLLLLCGWLGASEAADTTTTVSLIAFGDVNLGRAVGKRLIKGDTLFPFRKMMPVFSTADLVFVNLESQLSDQKGETQDPKNNLVFTGPPQGGETLRRGGIRIVSTANNHAFDYGLRALKETIINLDSSGIWHSGTALDSGSLYRPLIRSVSGIRFAFFAVTAVMNSQSHQWRPYIALADSGKLLPSIRWYRDSADIVIVSYHGDREYTRTPTSTQRKFFRQLVDAGVNIVIGHHSHVPQGIERYRDGWLVYSLGNFVFRQPQKFWTQRSFGVRWIFRRKEKQTRVTDVDVIPVSAGFQPVETRNDGEKKIILKRLRALSNVVFPWRECDSTQTRK